MEKPSNTLGQKTTSSVFSQWSEEHGVKPQGVTRRAQITLHSGTFKISGPPELITETQTLAEVMKGQEPDDIKWQIFTQVWCNWHVICSVSGDKILLCDLRYWDVEKNLIFRDPTLIHEGTKEPVALSVAPST